MLRTSLRRLAAVVGTSALAGMLLAAPALAHVTVDPSEASRGGYATLTFRVPNESDTASTVKLEIVFPADKPVASMRVRPVPGWQAAVQKVALATPVDNDGRKIDQAVGRIVFTASSPAAGVRPGQFQEFAISGGPLPKADTLVFKVLQTYSDGTVARWIEEPTGAGEPEYPAPVVTLVAGKTDGDHHGGDTAGTKDPAKATDHHGSSGTTALTVGGLVAGLAGLVVGGWALRRTRGRREPSAGSAATANPEADSTPPSGA